MELETLRAVHRVAPSAPDPLDRRAAPSVVATLWIGGRCYRGRGVGVTFPVAALPVSRPDGAAGDPRIYSLRFTGRDAALVQAELEGGSRLVFVAAWCWDGGRIHVRRPARVHLYRRLGEALDVYLVG